MATPDVTQLLLELGGGNRQALDALMPLVYDELRRIAHRQMASERAGHTLDSVALVGEAFAKLVNAAPRAGAGAHAHAHHHE